METAHAILRGFGRRLGLVGRRLAAGLSALPAMKGLGAFIHECCATDRPPRQSHSTHFLRNVAQLEVLRDIVARDFTGPVLRIASIGCSTGAEFYSALWMIRLASPRIRVIAHGVDVSAGVVEVARRAVYRLNRPTALNGLFQAGQPEFLAAEIASLGGVLEPVGGDAFAVRSWLREDTSWSVCDAADPRLLAVVGRQDIVMTNNLLGPMEDVRAEACLRNLVRLMKPGGHLVLEGLNLDLKARVTAALGLIPVTSRIEEIHTAAPTTRCRRFGRRCREPMDLRRSDWRHRYATIFAAPLAP